MSVVAEGGHEGLVQKPVAWIAGMLVSAVLKLIVKFL